MNECLKCGAKFEYEPKYHRCPGEWEALAGPPPPNPYAGMSWDEECVAKVMKRRPSLGARLGFQPVNARADAHGHGGHHR